MIFDSPSSNIPGEPTPCLFSGVLDGDQDSLVLRKLKLENKTFFDSPKKFFLSLNTRCQWAGVATKQRYPWLLSASKTTSLVFAIIIQAKNIQDIPGKWEDVCFATVLMTGKSPAAWLTSLFKEAKLLRSGDIRIWFLWGDSVFPRFDYSLNI